jgi:predicted aspartyl protease
MRKKKINIKLFKRFVFKNKGRIRITSSKKKCSRMTFILVSLLMALKWLQSIYRLRKIDLYRKRQTHKYWIMNLIGKSISMCHNDRTIKLSMEGRLYGHFLLNLSVQSKNILCLKYFIKIK